MDIDNKVAVIGIVVNNREEAAARVNDILSDFGDIIVGRMGIPYKEKGISVISIIVAVPMTNRALS
jgi:putative iron-only hydrogenase system regulator